jgi:uncharacterized protein YozE (UPF0346 family)
MKFYKYVKLNRKTTCKPFPKETKNSISINIYQGKLFPRKKVKDMKQVHQYSIGFFFDIQYSIGFDCYSITRVTSWSYQTATRLLMHR